MNRHIKFACFIVTLTIAISACWAPKASADDWPQWRGPNRDGKSAETGLFKTWGSNDPTLVWTSKGLGSGYSSVAVAKGKIYTLGTRSGGQYLIALDEKTGKEIWSLKFSGTPKVSRGPGARGTPTVDEDRVYGIGADGTLICADVKSGKKIWVKNFKSDFGGKMMSNWGFSESPLVDGKLLLCTPGGSRGMIVALDKMRGRGIWATVMPKLGGKGKDGAGYSSMVISKGAGVKQYVQMIGRGVIGVRASDGKFLWVYNNVANGVANVPTPIIAGDFVFGSSSYGTGSGLVKLTRSGSGVMARQQYFLNKDTFQNHHGGMVMVGEHIYSGHNHNQGFPICIHAASGKVVWGGDQRGPGDGSAAVIYADGHLIFRYQNGVVGLIEANPKAYKLIAKFTPAYVKPPSWSHPVVANGMLYLREQDQLMCYKLK